LLSNAARIVSRHSDAHSLRHAFANAFMASSRSTA
jgi:site-specific recombinase XerC